MARMWAVLLAIIAAGVSAAAGAFPFVLPGAPVADDTIRVTTLGSGSPDVRRHQVDAMGPGGGACGGRARTRAAAPAPTFSPDVQSFVILFGRLQVASGFLIELGNGQNFIFDLGTGTSCASCVSFVSLV
jgi:hypothetical protein